MTLDDKVRQLVVVGFSGTTAPEAMIRRLRPGGVIYFAPNVVDLDQVDALSAATQQVARKEAQPLLVMADQEGGLVTRMPGTEGVPGGADFAGNTSQARRTARDTGRLLRRVGVNVDLAPVADVNTVGNNGVIGTRSFSADPAVAARMVRAQVCGYHSGGVAAAAKHYPGHGSTTTDSHLAPATIGRDLAAWRRTDLPPFTAAARAHVDLVMLGHLAFPALDPSGRPATISPPIIRSLRREAGFDGVVVTDALNMGGITSYGDTGTIAVRALASGVDLLLMPPQPARAVEAVLVAVRDGRLPVERLDASVRRVLLLKARLGLYGGAPELSRTC